MHVSIAGHKHRLRQCFSEGRKMTPFCCSGSSQAITGTDMPHALERVVRLQCHDSMPSALCEPRSDKKKGEKSFSFRYALLCLCSFKWALTMMSMKTRKKVKTYRLQSPVFLVFSLGCLLKSKIPVHNLYKKQLEFLFCK